jgi:hypothetical protein
LGSEGGFHFKRIWDEELETEMGSRGTEGSAKEKGNRLAMSRIEQVAGWAWPERGDNA